MNTTAVDKRFEVVRCLGEGGMGVVYEARDRRSGTRVALKTLRHMTAASLAGLKREFRAMQDVHHENLVALGELVSEPDGCFFTMELVDGSDLVEYVRLRPAIARALEDLATDPAPVEVEPSRTSSKPPGDGGAQYGFDEARLRAAMRQLAEALCALHSAGLVHRDVKSSNVRVARNGRVVLLDFGLVADRATESPWTQQNAGTPAYMAPEQITGAKVGPEADWYAFGVLLFEALTGKLPFEGHPFHVMRRKQKEQPPAPSSLVAGVPNDLGALCVDLLHRDPAGRPTAPDVLRRLGANVDSRPTLAPHAQSTGFVGRRAELDALMSAFEDCRCGKSVTVVVEGESGVGKSALVRCFARQAGAEQPAVLVLVGRCYERESVAYKGFDGIVDALARFLVNMEEDVDRLLPTRVAPLVKVFPVLRRVAAIADRTRGHQAEVPKLTLRDRAFAALREMFARLAECRPVILAIDDAQWCDTDSLELLSELLRPPDAPPLLLVLTVRASRGAARRPAEPGTALGNALRGDVRRMEVGPLPPGDANELAARLLERSGIVDAKLASWSVRQSGGHPLFIDMIMRHADRYSGAATTKLALEDVLWAHVEELHAAPRSVLERVVVAASPLPREVVRRAASLGADAFAKAIGTLRAAHLIQTGGPQADRIEPYHDKVRAAVLAHLGDDARTDGHRRIAVALETSEQPDPETLVLHWQGAGEADWAAHYAAIAGDRASDALAFDRAAGFYEVALASGDMPTPERRPLLVKLAWAQECAGRGERSARAYLEAAQEAAPLERAELERAASVELLSSGRIEEGGVVLHRVLAAVGYQAPGSPLASLFWLALYSVWLRVRGLCFRERSTYEVRREDRARIDALFQAGMGLAMLDAVLAVCLSARSLIAALRNGDRSQVLRAALLRVNTLAAAGRSPGRQERALSAIVSRLAEMEDSAGTRAFLHGSFGVQSYMRGRWKEARAQLDQSLSITESHDHVAGWRSYARVYGCWTLNYLGEYLELAREHTRALEDAEHRGDMYTSVQLRDGSLVQVWLAGDDPADARRHIAEAITRWPDQRYLLQHWHASIGEAEIRLYEGDGAAAFARLDRDAAALNRSLLLNVQHIRGVNSFVRGRCAIASLHAQPSLREARLREARSMARGLERERMVWTAPLAALLLAGIADACGDPPAAARHLRSATDLAAKADMSGHANAARHQLGVLLGGDEGGALVRQATDAMKAQGIRAPARFAATLAPGRWGRNP